MTGRNRILLGSLAVGIVATMAVCILCLASLNMAIGYALLSQPNALPKAASVVNTLLGLRFELSMNRSSLASGGAVMFQVDVQNTLSISNQLNRSDNWKATGLRVGPCGALAEEHPPFGYAILHGFYTLDNLWVGTRLDVNGPGIYMCPQLYLDMSKYVFAPSSDTAALYPSNSPDPAFTAPMRLEESYTGYWSGIPFVSSSETFHTFQPGVFTLVAGDEWGDLVILHFVVK